MLTGYTFDLDGGRLPLDFANTLSRQSGDHLPDYRELVSFGLQSGLLDEPRADRLMQDAAERPAVADEVLARAHALRASLFSLFVAAVRGEPHDPAALAGLNQELARTLPNARVSPTSGGYTWTWDEADALDRVLWPIARAAADLLASPDELPRVRLCAADDCDWLFLDASKNRSRQWCSMQSCGNRAKARRYHQRHRLT